MAEFRFDVGTKIRGELLKRGKRSIRIFDDEFGKALEKSAAHLHALVVGGTPVDTSALRGSIAREVRGSGLNIRGIVGSPSKYALPVEEGQRPHFPPLGPIIQWIKRKFGGENTWIRAFGLGKAIARRGVAGRFMFKKGFEKGKGKILGWMKDARDRVISRLK